MSWFATHAQAKEGNSALSLKWHAPPECKSGEQVRAEVLQMAKVEAGPHLQLSAQVEIQYDAASGYVLLLSTGDKDRGVRRFHAPTCDAVTDAAKVTLALILNPLAEPEEESDEPSQKEDLRAKEPSSPVQLRFSGAALVGLQIGALPQPGLIVGAEIGAVLDRFSLSLAGDYGLTQEAHLTPDGSAGARLRLFEASALGCIDLLRGRFRPSLCTGATFHHIWGEGMGISNERSGQLFWTAIKAGPRVEVALSKHFGARLSGLFDIPLARPTAYLEDLGVVFQPPPVGALIHFAAVGYFP